MYKVSETVLPIYINGQCPIIKTCSDVTLNLSSKDSTIKYLCHDQSNNHLLIYSSDIQVNYKLHLDRVLLKLLNTLDQRKGCQVMIQSKKEGKDQESIQPNTLPDPGYQLESDNVTIRQIKREPRGQPFPSNCPQGINNQTRTKA